MDDDPIVYLVAGDCSARRILAARLLSLERPFKACRSAQEFFEVHEELRTGCVLLDVSQPEFDLELLGQLGDRAAHLPIIAISGSPNIAMAVKAMKSGCLDFLEVSCPDEQLTESIEEAFRWYVENRRHIVHGQTIRRRLSRLLPEHRAVLDLILAGKSNRDIAVELGISVRAIEMRRAKVMHTMKAKSLTDLVRQSLIAEGFRFARPAAKE